jgi:hypothetical protein
VFYHQVRADVLRDLIKLLYLSYIQQVKNTFFLILCSKLGYVIYVKIYESGSVMDSMDSSVDVSVKVHQSPQEMLYFLCAINK